MSLRVWWLLTFYIGSANTSKAATVTLTEKELKRARETSRFWTESKLDPKEVFKGLVHPDAGWTHLVACTVPEEPSEPIKN